MLVCVVIRIIGGVQQSLQKISTSDNLAQKSAIYGEGSGPKRLPEGPKSAISEKELAIFELRKVLFSEKHLRASRGLCGSCAHTGASRAVMRLQ